MTHLKAVVRLRTLGLALACLGVGGGLWLAGHFFGADFGEPASTRIDLPGGPGRSDAALLVSRALALEEERRKLDETVWGPELAALKHEEVILDLWDRLRRSEDPFTLLSEFPWGELAWNQPEDRSLHEDGIERWSLGSSEPRADAAALRERLSQWQAAGWQIEQTEWRHPRFDPGPPATSVFWVVLHAVQRQRQQRLIVRGRLTIEWMVAGNALDQPQVRRTHVGEVEVLYRAGPAAFEHRLSTAVVPEPCTVFIDPLLMYDLDRDGRSELLLGCKNLVFWNEGQGSFRREAICPAMSRPINAALIADFDGDGRADLLAAAQEGLLLSSGDLRGRFPNAPRAVWRAATPLLNAYVLAAGDVDGDQDLDVWVAQYKLPYVAGQMPTPYYDANDGFPSYLLINDGRGGFRDGTVVAGLAAKRFRRTYGASWVDLDADDDLDLLVTSDFAGVDLYRNNGLGQFTDVTDEAFDDRHAFGMAHTLGDYNLDGHLDLLVIGMNLYSAERMDHLRLDLPGARDHLGMRSRMAYGNRLYLHDNGRWVSSSLSDAVARSGWSWGATSFDVDLDGDLDIYITNGHKSRASARDYESQFWRHDIYVASSEPDPARDLYFGAVANRLYGAGYSYGGYEKNRLYVNEAGRSFLEAGYLLGVSMERDCRNVVSDDLDGDGRPDLVVLTYEEWPQPRQTLNFFRNALETGRNWIGVRLHEHPGGFSPVGARVTLVSEKGTLMRQFITGDSHRSQHANTAHFGLGDAREVKRLEVRWPNSVRQELIFPAVNRYHEVLPPRS